MPGRIACADQVGIVDGQAARGALRKVEEMYNHKKAIVSELERELKFLGESAYLRMRGHEYVL